MNTYEINDITVHVPTSWDDITVATYDRVWRIKPQTPRERANVIATACNVDLQVLLDEPTEVFNMIRADVDFLFNDNPVPPVPHVQIGETRYNVAIEEKLSFGEYIDADEVQKNSDAILSNVLAIVCRPAGEKYNPDNNDERATMFGALPMSQVQGVLAFFFAILSSIDTTYAAVRQPSNNGRPVAPEYRAFAKAWGFYKVVADLADNKIWLFDEVTARPVTEVFTFLLYQRDKAPAELAQSRLDRKWAKLNRQANADS